LSLVGAPVIGSKVLSATPDGVNHLTSLRRAKLSPEITELSITDVRTLFRQSSESIHAGAFSPRAAWWPEDFQEARRTPAAGGDEYFGREGSDRSGRPRVGSARASGLFGAGHEALVSAGIGG